MDASSTKKALTPSMVIGLAAPHTWPASIMPVLLGIALAYAQTGTIKVTVSLCLLIICILMQSSVNTFNDYFDFKRGADSAEDAVEEHDSVLVYNDIDPKSALGLAIAFLGIAFLLGLYIIVVAGWVPLAIAAGAAVVVVLYSGGKTPLSYLPLGELVSGVVMGGAIPFAVHYVLTKELSPLVLLMSLPPIIGIALIMATNNTCDIEKDSLAKRCTLPTKLGRSTARKLYRTLLASWILSILILVTVFFTGGLLYACIMVLACYGSLRALWTNPLSQASRIAAMGQICSLNVMLGATYVIGILAGTNTFYLF